MRYILTVVICLAAVTLAQAQVYRFKSYNAGNGLPSNTVWTIFQDHKGYLWIGTDSGLCRYDGVNFTTFGVQQGLAGTSVRKIFEDRQGRLWVTTGGGISCYDGVRFTNYTPAQGLPDIQTYAGLCTHDGMLWFSTTKELCRFDGTRFTCYGTAQGLPSSPIWVLFEDHAGVLWIGTRGGGLVKFADGRFTHYGRQEGLPNDDVFGVAEDPAGGLWIGTDGGLSFFDGKSFRTYTQADGLTSNFVGRLLVDRYHRVWCTTYGGGLSRFENGRFTNFNRGSGVPDNFLTALYEDYEGNIWCGTRSKGIFRFSNELFAGYTEASGLGEGRITGVGETPDGTLWVSSVNSGLSAFNAKGPVRHYGIKDGLLEESLWALYVDRQGRVWTGGNKSVSCFDGRQFRNYTLEEIGARGQISTIIEDRQGNLWFGSFPIISTGVIRYDGRQFTRYTKEQGLGSNPVNSFALDRAGNLWMCSEDGLTRYDGERFTVYGTERGLPSRRVQCAYEDQEGQLWVGTDSGLCRFDGKRFYTYTTADGLVSNVIRTITRHDGVLWIGTSRGISVFDGGRFRNFTTKDGLVSDDISPNACLERRDGSLWFGTNEGVIRYRAVPEIARSVPPRVHINRVVADDQALKVLPGPDGDSEGGTVPPISYDRNSVTFEFVAPSFTDEEAMRFSFFLEGFDRTWSPADAQHSARFTNLPSGHYQFQVKACSAAGVWSQPQVVNITIGRPYWQTWWFRLLVAGTTLALVYTLFAWRIQVLRRRQVKKVKHLRQLQEQRLEHLRQIQEERLEGLRQLLESIRVINSQLDLYVVLQKIAEECAQLVDGVTGGIGLIEGDGVVFKRMWANDRWEDLNISFPMGEGVAGYVAETSRAMIVNDPKHSPQIAYPELIEKYHMAALMCVPILARTGKIVGVLTVYRRQEGKPFTETDCRLMESLAHQAAVAIENATLYGELEEKNLMIAESLRELEKLYRNEQEVTRTLQELNQMKTNFITVTSHEMRTPLTVLKGYTEALQEGLFGPLTETQERTLATCQRMVERLVSSFSDILEMLKIQEGRVALKYTRMDLSATVRETLSELVTFAERRHLQLVCESPETLLMSADQEKIQLVLVNLIQNAIKFTYDGGTIRVRVNQEPDGAHLAVQDTGIGIEPGEIERIFEMFYTSTDTSKHTSGRFEFAAQGTGLGLAITKSYVEAHGGRIWAESAGKGEGSCFHVVLPCIEEGETADVEGTRHKAQGTRHKEAEPVL